MLKFNFLTNRKVLATCRLSNSRCSGSALIVALLVMGVLMAISLALSTLIFREARITREFLDAGQAYYAAESATEIGLYGLKNNLPGWELTPDSPDGKYKSIKIDDKTDPAAVAELKVNNKCTAYPCFDEGFDVGTADLKAFYGVLGLNESITIPLFVSDGITVRDVKNFTVEYYAGFNPTTDLDPKLSKLGNLNGWDVLKWKLMGINNKTPDNKPVTETLSDFTAVTTTTGDVATNAQQPSWFGTINCSDGSERYTGKITCIPFEYLPNDKQSCLNPELHAREYYKYGYSGDSAKVDPNNHCYLIKDFVAEHTLNYLTLTNMINPGVFKTAVVKKSDALTKLYYRVELFTDDGKNSAQTVREYADITANGYSGNSKQSINVKIKRDSFMPVFNFSLYSTYMDTTGAHTGDDGGVGKAHDEEYWYGKK